MEKIKELYFTFSGRIDRGQFILGQLGLIALIVVFTVLMGVMAAVPFGAHSQGQDMDFNITAIIIMLITFIAMIASFIGSVALHIKRFHDIDMSGWWTLLAYLPYIGLLVSLIICFIPGTPGENRFGPALSSNEEKTSTPNNKIEE